MATETASAAPPRAGRRVWWALGLIALLLVAIFAVRVLPHLGAGTFNSRDEYLTLDRTVSLLRTGDWTTIHTNHEPSFRKPPLQYWLGAALLSTGMDRELALRLVALAGGLGMLAMTGLLAARMARDLVPARDPRLVAGCAVLLLAGSRSLWRYSTEAMLDTGTGFWLAATAVAFLAALDRPRRMWLVVACVGFGALQKAPVAAMLVVCGLLALAAGRRARRLRGAADVALLRPGARRAFSLALICLVPAALVWPLMQVALHGIEAFRLLVMDEMVSRFAPEVETAAHGVEWPEWVARDSALLWLPGLLATLALPVWMRTTGARMVWLWTVAFFAAMTFAGGATYPRYLLSVSPFVAVALALTIFRLAARDGRALALAAVAGLAAPGIVSARVGETSPRRVEAEAALRALAASAAPEDRLVACQTSGRAQELMVVGAIGFFASAGQPVGIFRDPADLAAYVEATPPGTVLRGICLSRDMGQIRALRPDLTETARGDYVIWSAPARG
ncbi:glycosyltransferase family 39 protein [Frigidibacter sp. MR17.24]